MTFLVVSHVRIWGSVTVFQLFSYLSLSLFFYRELNFAARWFLIYFGLLSCLYSWALIFFSKSSRLPVSRFITISFTKFSCPLLTFATNFFRVWWRDYLATRISCPTPFPLSLSRFLFRLPFWPDFLDFFAILCCFETLGSYGSSANFASSSPSSS